MNSGTRRTISRRPDQRWFSLHGKGRSGDDLKKIPGLLGLARFSLKIIRQNLFFSFPYNAIGIPIAAAGILNPVIAALAMFASSVTVICNTSRISRFSSTSNF